jgi:hypothetical protein
VFLTAQEDCEAAPLASTGRAFAIALGTLQAHALSLACDIEAHARSHGVEVRP